MGQIDKNDKNDKRVVQIGHAYESGRAKYKIAKDAGINDRELNKILISIYGYLPRRKCTMDDKVKVSKLLAKGKTIEEVAKEVGLMRGLMEGIVTRGRKYP